jgi:hypothetical protein
MVRSEVGRWRLGVAWVPRGAVTTAVRGRYAPNALGNFEFDVTLSYRRLERPRRVPDGA